MRVEAEIDDVDRDFWVIDVLELVPDFHLEVRGFHRDVGRRARVGCLVGFGINAERIGVQGVDAGQTEVGRHGVGAAERLGDDDLQTLGQLDHVAAGNLDGIDFAFEFERAVHVEGK